MKLFSKRRRLAGYLLMIAVLAIVVIVMPDGKLVAGYWLHLRIQRERDPSAKVVRINSTLGFEEEIWNPRYLQYCLKAEDPLVRTALAQIIKKRYGSDARSILAKLLEKAEESSAEDVTNVRAVISRCEAE